MGKKFENVESFKYFGSLLNFNDMEIEIKSRLATDS
jgi:hypothetical protein